MVEGTPLLREHAAYTRIEGSNPSVSASKIVNKRPLGRFVVSTHHITHRTGFSVSANNGRFLGAPNNNAAGTGF